MNDVQREGGVEECMTESDSRVRGCVLSRLVGHPPVEAKFSNNYIKFLLLFLSQGT
jgi:hypothetical protein